MTGCYSVQPFQKGYLNADNTEGGGLSRAVRHAGEDCASQADLMVAALRWQQSICSMICSMLKFKYDLFTTDLRYCLLCLLKITFKNLLASLCHLYNSDFLI